MTESITYSSIRAFFVALFAMIGLAVGLLIFILIFAVFSSVEKSEPEQQYTAHVVANANDERTVQSSTSPIILKLNIDGIIGTDSLSMETVRQQLIESREGDLKKRVKAILLAINSPGGTVFDADGIYRAIKNYKEQYKVPVYAYVDGLCASGGMYVAAAADKIYASDVSMIGSVGVLSPSFFNFSQLMDKIGVQSLTVSAGKDKDELNPFRPWKEGESNNVQALVNYYYAYFVDILTASRPQMDKEKLIQEYGAKVFNAAQAKEYGYITENGLTLKDTLKLLLKDIGIEDNFYEVVELKKSTWYSQLFSTQCPLLTGKISHEIQLSPYLDPKLLNQFLYLYQPER